MRITSALQTVQTSVKIFDVHTSEGNNSWVQLFGKSSLDDIKSNSDKSLFLLVETEDASIIKNKFKFGDLFYEAYFDLFVWVIDSDLMK